jgi:hypothetical protein
MGKTLDGDRGVEWQWARDNLPPLGQGKTVLDFGPADGFHLSMDAYQKGYTVIAIGLEDIKPPIPGIQYLRQDILETNFDQPFDYILNVSTTEHVGLGRYGDPLGDDHDLMAMQKLREWMRLDGDGFQLLTIPVGQDAIVGHWHRAYGEKRLPMLLDGYTVLKEQFWRKADDNSKWILCSKERALTEVPGQVPEPSMLNLSYALGCFVLCAS